MLRAPAVSVVLFYWFPVLECKPVMGSLQQLKLGVVVAVALSPPVLVAVTSS